MHFIYKYPKKHREKDNIFTRQLCLKQQNRINTQEENNLLLCNFIYAAFILTEALIYGHLINIFANIYRRNTNLSFPERVQIYSLNCNQVLCSWVQFSQGSRDAPRRRIDKH